MNVLLTSSGRRTYLCDYFKEALKGKGLVFASNSSLSPALLNADGYGISPLISSKDYLPWLLSFCKEKRIGLIVPLFDQDVTVLSGNRELFEREGITVAVSPYETVRIAEDKYRMGETLNNAGIRTPDCVLTVREALSKVSDGSLSWPLIVKPRFGMGSIGIFEAENKEELDVLYKMCLKKIRETYLKNQLLSDEGSVLIEERIPGEEYGLDVICDFKGGYQGTVVRKKIAMRSGETDEAVILGKEDPAYEILVSLGERLASALTVYGNLDADVMMGPDLLPYVIDLNARFGGGYPFSHLAGVDLPAACLLWAEGKKADPSLFEARPGTHGYKDISVKEY